MNRLKRFTITLCLAMLGQLAGTSAHAAFPVPAVLVQAADRIVSAAGYAAQIQPIVETDPVESVRRQADLVRLAGGSGNVILWPGKWPHAWDNFATLVAEAAKHPGTFTHVYMVAKDGDEIFWCTTGTCIGRDEDALIEGARLAHAAGLKTICTFLPDVILDPRFALRNMTMCDGIAVDVYPSIRPTVPDFGTCRFNDNHIANLYYCSFQKLERMGHKGPQHPKGCLAQAFGLVHEPLAALRAGLALQRQALVHAKALGCDYISPWGQYLSAQAKQAEPIFDLDGHELEWMVQP